MSDGVTPAGWYPDVEVPGGERYWDGSIWTEQRRSGSGADATVTPSSAQPLPGNDTPPAFGGQQPPAFGDQQPPAYGQQPPAYGQQPPAYGQQPPAYGQQPPPYGQPAYNAPQGYQPYGGFGQAYLKSSNAGVALGLAIASIFFSFCCGIGALLAIPGAIMGWNEMQAIDRGEIDPSNRGTAKGAFVVSVVVLGLAAAGIVLYAIVIIAA